MNSLFDDLKKIKKELSAEEKRENQEKSAKLRHEKEEKLKKEFLEFIKENDVKKI